jgi:hypothetical protein
LPLAGCIRIDRVAGAFSRWLCGVETVGRTIEELEEIYNQPYPPFASRKYNATVAVDKDGKAVGVVEDGH